MASGQSCAPERMLGNIELLSKFFGWEVTGPGLVPIRLQKTTLQATIMSDLNVGCWSSSIVIWMQEDHEFEPSLGSERDPVTNK